MRWDLIDIREIEEEIRRRWRSPQGLPWQHDLFELAWLTLGLYSSHKVATWMFEHPVPYKNKNSETFKGEGTCPEVIDRDR